MINNQKIILVPITPIHIGNGKEILPYEYVIKNGYMYKFNMMDIYENLNENNKRIFLKYVENDIIELRSFIGEIYEEKFGYEYKVDICTEFENLYNQKLKGVKNKNEQNALVINDFINTVNKTYIPGSSIKGAIRSAYLYDMGDREKLFDYKILKNNKGRIDPYKSEHKKSEEYEVELLSCPNKNGKKEPKTDPFKSIKITDSNFMQDALRLYDINIYTYNKKDKKLKKAVPFYSLCTKSKLCSDDNIEFNFDINIFNGFFEKGSVKVKIGKNEILDSLNLKAEDMINRELDFFDEADYLETYNIYEDIYEIYESLDKNNEALIRFGKGAGFDSTTFNLVNNNRSNVTDSKSRNLVEGKYPLGWAVIKFV
ncbi:type III-A CRISPR-associated RAMP protein Csm5 [Romboutsia maritimum]|uniref:CRISPR system Cms protein Csm5 n=1 Tax=Romboutsia maritimum TaxID=2020948 RepID=A0A371ITI6_9FIRM|nr:type III-A CRISPR-associated RAMP protein Csm5 [Romboutsia maritimum]RDY23791.1 type III-A CRISPR-associated RAMP protein Csm5 [Romboutsia maritimum]